MLVFNSNSFVVKYEKKKDQLSLRCLNQLQSNDFKGGLIGALAYAQKHEVKYWFLDLSEVSCLNEEEITFVSDCLVPQIMISLGTANFVAVLLSDERYQFLLEKVGRAGLKSFNSFIVLSVFCDKMEARTWLNLQKH